MKSPTYYRSDQIGSDNYSLGLLKNDLRRYPGLNNEQILRLLKNRERDACIEGLTRYIRCVAVHLRPPRLDESEAIGVALLQLVESIDELLSRDPADLPPGPKQYLKKAIVHALTRHAFSESSPATIPYTSNARRAQQSAHTALLFDQALTGRPLRLSEEVRDDDGTGTGETNDTWIASQTYWLPDGTRADTPYEPTDSLALQEADRQIVHAVLEAAKPPLTDDEALVIDLRFGLTSSNRIENGISRPITASRWTS